jgi:putative hydrolase of the HAD superfamily
VRAQARELWRTSPTSGYCARIGISSTEGLWCRFEGDSPITQELRRWTAVYRAAAWASALAAHGLSDGDLAESLAERFATERRARHRIFPDVVPALSGLRKHYQLGLITNGASCLQWEKIDRSGLRQFFDVIVVSGDLGAGKPDSAIFRHALSRFAGPLSDAVMLGDSIASDIDGAQSVGLRTIWVNRLHHQRPPNRRELREVATLADVGALLAGEP